VFVPARREKLCPARQLVSVCPVWPDKEVLEKVSDVWWVAAPTYQSGPSGDADHRKEHIMTTTQLCTTSVTAAVGAAIAAVAAPALLFLGVGSCTTFLPRGSVGAATGSILSPTHRDTSILAFVRR
jgi:hypothetical protein